MTEEARIPAPGEVGVQYNPPPAEIIPKVMGDIERAIASIGDADVALVAVADRQGGWNSALVMRAPKGIAVQTWVGKSWGTDAKLDYGVQVRWTMKFSNGK